MKESVAKVIDPEIQAERKQKFVNGLKGLAKNVGSAALSAGGSLLNTGLSYLLNRKQMRDQADLQRQQYDYELNAESPENQRKRLEAAGLNPALMYQNGQAGTISASMGSPSALPIQGSNLGTSILQGMETMARIRNLDQNTAKQKTETDYNYESMQSRLAMVSSDALLKKYGADIKAIDALYHEEVTKENLNQLRKFIDKLSFDMQNAKDLTDLERQKVKAYVNDLIKKHSLWESQIDLNKAKTTTEGTIQDRNEWEAAHLRAKNYWMNELKPAEKSKIQSEINELISRAGLNDQKAKYAKLYAITECIKTGVHTLAEIRKWIKSFCEKSEDEQNSVIQKINADPEIIWDVAQIASSVLD